MDGEKDEVLTGGSYEEGTQTASDQTHTTLIETALDLFGSKGFNAASTREIAATAKANIASIGYHFSGKDGLRRACAEYAASFIGSVTHRGFSSGHDNTVGMPAADEARRELTVFISTVTQTLLTSRAAQRIVRFILRELTDQSPVLPVIYSAVVEPTHRRLCRLWSAVTGEDADDEIVKLAVFAILGQAIYFRIGEPIITRRMNWDGYDNQHADRIVDEIIANLNSALDRHTRSPANQSIKDGKKS